jgi:hypothetical protein
VFLGKSSWIFALRTRLLERFVSEHRRMVTDAGVLQEILHRYSAINRHYHRLSVRDAVHLAVMERHGIDRF